MLGKTRGVMLGKTIERIAASREDLRITFADGGGVRLWDDGQSCCEERYMTCDDDLLKFVGAQLLGFEVRDGAGAGIESDDYDDVHDVQFLLVHTSLGTFTVATHNEHNGYYGGFSLRCAELEDE